MWRESESSIKPLGVDETSSEMYVYVRKNIREAEKEGEKVFCYLEQKIKKEDWELYKTINEHSTELSDVEDALMELAEIVIGGNE